MNWRRIPAGEECIISCRDFLLKEKEKTASNVLKLSGKMDGFRKKKPDTDSVSGCSKRIMGIEPTSQPWEGRILPMNYIRINSDSITDFGHKINIHKIKKYVDKN